MAEIHVIDDDRFVLAYFEELLSPLGHRTHGHSSAVSFLARLTRDDLLPPDLIITDVMLPAIDGFKICEAVRHTPNMKDVPIVVMTGLSWDAGLEERVRNQYNVTTVLQKPLTPDGVRRGVERALKPIVETVEVELDLEQESSQITTRVVLYGTAGEWAERLQRSFGYFERSSLSVSLCRRWSDLAAAVQHSGRETTAIVMADPKRAQTVSDELRKLSATTRATLLLLDGTTLTRIGVAPTQHWETSTGSELYLRFGEVLGVTVRNNERYAVQLTGSILADGEEPAQLTDLSIGGARLVVHREREIGAAVRLRFGLPEVDAIVDQKALVRWVADLPDLARVAGVSFDHLTRETAAALRAFFAKLR